MSPGPERFFSGLKKLIRTGSRNHQVNLPPVVSYDVSAREAELILSKSLALIEDVLEQPTSIFTDSQTGRMLGFLRSDGYTQIGLYNAGKYQDGAVRRGTEGLPYYFTNRGNLPLDVQRRIALIEFDADHHQIVPMTTPE